MHATTQQALAESQGPSCGAHRDDGQQLQRQDRCPRRSVRDEIEVLETRPTAPDLVGLWGLGASMRTCTVLDQIRTMQLIHDIQTPLSAIRGYAQLFAP